MQQKEIEEGNRLIALFMDLRVPLVGQPAFKGQEVGTMYVEPSKIKNWENVELSYRTSWDWLMPVIEKIESDERFGEPIVSITADGCTIFGQYEHPPYINKHGWGTKLESTFHAVVEFIKHHNSQNKSDGIH